MTSTKLRRDQFPHRARAIFYSRLALDSFGILFLLVPTWTSTIVPFLSKGLVIYLFMLAGHLFSYIWIGRRWDRVIYFLSLCIDILALGTLIVLTGGLASPLMSGLILYTVVFAILYPHPLAILPPLLLLPVMAKISQLMGTEMPGRDLLLLLWYSGLSLITVYVVVYFDFKENIRYWKEKKLQDEKNILLVVNERQRMAREMHDGLGALLSAIKIQAEFLTEISRDEGQEIAEEASALHERTAMALVELRRTVRILREDFELENALDELIQNMEAMWKYKVEFQSSLGKMILDKTQQLNLYRIIQESLTNTGKHGKACNVTIALTEAKRPKWLTDTINSLKGVRMTIVDDGCGFSPDEKKEGHYGLVHLMERSRELGGDARVESTPGTGTHIELWFPLEGKSPEEVRS
ncbi:sensor histidine kinase [Myxococcota bacterium]|nr:sensor histidine kinase [Myxococcota bacterium]MBU1534286.1 sensor histidine kinase [Myxococcota bacterium]